MQRHQTTWWNGHHPGRLPMTFQQIFYGIVVIWLAITLLGCTGDVLSSSSEFPSLETFPNSTEALSAPNSAVEETSTTSTTDTSQPSDTGKKGDVDRSTSRTKQTRPSGGTQNITFDTVMFEMEKNDEYSPELLTDTIRNLDNRRVVVRGYMLPTSVFQQEGIKQFVLVRDNQECCFGPGAMLYDCMIVKMAAQETATFSVFPMAIEGTFRLHEYRIGKRLYGIYRLDDAKMR
ncbi:Hypothetical protein PBC10988_0440 [Planctomycetales bacterium 10988]|nr:Hypothetical protein PBC10988_0440 [Planctomycetales bacterium 10988]